MKNLLLSVACLFLLTTCANAQLTGMSPNQAVHNQTLQTTITSNGLFIQASSPNGNVFQVFLKQGGYTITVTDMFIWWDNTTVINSNTVQTDFFTIPVSAPAGVYDLEVLTADIFNPMSNWVTYTLPGAFTVLPPDGWVSGTVFEDLNQDGIKDPGEPGVAGRSVKLFPVAASSYTLTTDANGNYSFPAPNGSYNTTILASSGDRFYVTTQDTIPATVNNNTVSGIDFGIRYALQSVTPNIGYRGINTLHQIVSTEPIFTTGANAWGNVTQLRVLQNANPVVNVALAGITVIDPYTIQAYINVPTNVSTGPGRNIIVTVTGANSGTHWLKGKFTILTPPYFVSGAAFFDQNQNKIKDTGEPGIRNVKITMAPENSIAFTSYYGDYQLGSLGGAQTLSYNLGSITGLALFTDSSTYTFTANANITNKNFGFLSTNPDYSVQIAGTGLFARCNTQQYVTLEIRNISNIAYNVRPWVKFSSNMNFISSIPSGATVSNDTVFFPVFNILPYTSLNRYARFALPGVGSTVSYTAGATSLNGSGIDQLTNAVPVTMSVFCAYDPNDKQVTPPGIFAQNYTLMSDTLEYLIRFQNTGNDTAFKVVIVDTLDMDLDINTFELLGSSHDMMTEIKASGAMKFTFNNINLPDSNVNEPLSHGFIRYRVRVKPGLTDGTPVNNTAYIYFDFNPAIVTNTTLNTMVYVLPTGLEESGEGVRAVLYPNPFSTSATLHFGNEKGEMHTLVITDITGKQIAPTLQTRENSFVIERKNLARGVYFYQLRKENGEVAVGKFVVE